jgi:hypothetical protein
MSISLTVALANVWGQETFLHPDGQVESDARSLTAGSLPGTWTHRWHPRPYLWRWHTILLQCGLCSPGWSEARGWSHHLEMKHPVFN